ncbi:DUF6607 family protein [Acinetobacter larvae]|uniref:Uncharacterized protein n=1 Tax=Acinetobacter larvae TaxID=1789224 RepID=A0A1B2LW90_9GAMM|nr:DUF6607 family protein [Acinetobacter larvae]AOA57033.1 hypothetical protein BFG52_00785 [Acinetobacter larvae]
MHKVTSLTVLLASFLTLSGLSHAENVKTPVTTQNQVIAVTNTLSQAEAHAAILKMAGKFNVTFEFEELYSPDADYTVKDKTLTKAQDIVFPIEISENKISLQHVLLIPNGTVVKHWRQDWEYQPTQAWRYIGHYQWEKVQYDAQQVKGKWLQTVWNSDDSPRYAALGEWSNTTGMLAWASDLTDKPLPRREYSKRDDYDLMKSINRHVITPQGWVQEEENWKYQTAQQQSVVREVGINRYTQDAAIDDHAVTQYWQANQAYWAQVRKLWNQALSNNFTIALRSPEVKDVEPRKPHYIAFLDQAEALQGKKLSDQQRYQQAKQLLNSELIRGEVR